MLKPVLAAATSAYSPLSYSQRVVLPPRTHQLAAGKAGVGEGLGHKTSGQEAEQSEDDRQLV